MKLDYIPDINAFGGNVVRLYQFDKTQSILFRNAFCQRVLKEKQKLDLATLDFIECRNCNLVLRISQEDEGITTENNIDFVCKLRLKSYEKMLVLLSPFRKKRTIPYQYLYDVDSLTDFLFSPGGSWGE
jgi:hypothetical protein